MTRPLSPRSARTRRAATHYVGRARGAHGGADAGRLHRYVCSLPPLGWTKHEDLSGCSGAATPKRGAMPLEF